MKLLIVTQVVDTEDPILGFFHTWIIALAARVESVVVICLKEGHHELPKNVTVHSLGKERGKKPGIVYAIRFLPLAWKLRHHYDRVFVHMNQEYVLIAGWLWKLLRKPVSLWRNHYAGSWLTDLAASACTNMFCTSKHSYTAKYKKTLLMPVGVDLERFSRAGSVERVLGSVLFLARMAPSKRPDVLLDALSVLLQKRIPFMATFIGSPLTEHEAFYGALKERVRAGFPEGAVSFRPGMPNADTPDAFHAHDIFVNCSQSGMFDKTLFEAAASGCLVLAQSEDFKDRAGSQNYFEDATDLAERLDTMLALSPGERDAERARMRSLAAHEDLTALMDSLVKAL